MEHEEFTRMGLNVSDGELDLLCSTLDDIQKRHSLNRRDAMRLLFWLGAKGVYGTKPEDAHCQEKVEEAKRAMQEILDGPSKRSKSGGFLYFAESEKNNLFKIGMTRGSPLRRLPTIQTGCPYEIRLHSALYYERCCEKEREFHKLLAGHRTRGEWHEIDILVLEELITQEIVKSHISDTNALADTIVPFYIIGESERRLAKIGIALSEGLWPWGSDDAQGSDIDIGPDIEIDLTITKRRVPWPV